jgi:hypothetical protein
MARPTGLTVPRRETVTLWRPRSFDCAVRTVEEYNAQVEHPLESREGRFGYLSFHQLPSQASGPVQESAVFESSVALINW